MSQIQSFVLGTPVKMSCKKDVNESKQIFAKVLCSNLKDESFYSCITPHGTIIKTHFSNLYELIDESELSMLKELENNSKDLQNTIYNNIFTTYYNSGNH
jgi:hypothetical protein